MKKIAVLASLIMVVFVVGLAIFWSDVPSNTQPVQVAEVKLAALQSSINTNGKVEAEKVFELRAPISGLCRTISVREGDRLKAGQPILSLESPALKADLAAARAELVAAELDLRNIQRGPALEELNQAEADVTRYRLEVDSARKVLETNEWLLERNAIAKFELEQSRQALARARQALDAAVTRRDDVKKRYDDVDQKRAVARVEAAKSRIQYLENSITRSVVRAPASGTLYQFDVRDGAYLNTGDLLGLLADLGRLRVRAFVDEPELGRVTPGADVLVRWDARLQDSWKGKVTHIPSQVVARGSRSVAEVLCSISSSQQTLIPNINVDVEIITREGPLVPTLPRSAVFPEGKDHFVWVIRDNKVIKRTVETGRSTSTLIELTGGISLGERVIIPGLTPVSEGSRVHVSGQ